MISGMERAGVDHEALLDTYIRAINLCVKDHPADLTFGVHMCRGNFKVGLEHLSTSFYFLSAVQGGIHFSEGPYDRISVKLFNTLDVDTFYVSDASQLEPH